MIYKILYQEDKFQTPRREETHSIYVEADSSVEARELVEKNTEHNIEYVQELSDKHLEYEKENNDDFKITEF